MITSSSELFPKESILLVFLLDTAFLIARLRTEDLELFSVARAGRDDADRVRAVFFVVILLEFDFGSAIKQLFSWLKTVFR
jgi:hypothetical protein